MPAPDIRAIEDALAEYVRLSRWRATWQRLSARVEVGRSLAREERIDRRAALCNRQIRAVMRRADVLRAATPADDPGVTHKAAPR